MEERDLIRFAELTITREIINVKTIKPKFVEQMPDLSQSGNRSIDLTGYSVVGLVKGAWVVVKRDEVLAKVHATNFFGWLWDTIAQAGTGSIEVKDARELAKAEFDKIPQLFED
jgi:hypothetical protein